MAYGAYYEDLEPGRQFRHWPGRTINEFDDTLFSLLSMNQHPVHLDEHYAKGTQHGKRLVAGPVVISLVIGMTQADIGGRSLQTLSYSDVRHVAPVFHDDTIYAESNVVEKRDGGVVVVDTKAVNQHQETILTMRRTIVVPSAPAK